MFTIVMKKLDHIQSLMQSKLKGVETNTTESSLEYPYAEIADVMKIRNARNNVKSLLTNLIISLDWAKEGRESQTATHRRA